jgi:membrane fusion protein (multidrug efflux system)
MKARQSSKARSLFSISKQDYAEELTHANADLKSALADAKAAELDVQNEQMLVDKKVVSATELDMAKAKLEAARARVDEARSTVASANLNLSYTEIKAPFDGVIDRIPNKTGSLIDEGTLLTTISDNKAVFAYFNVSEETYLQFSKIDKGRDVQLVLADNSVYPCPGKVETVESEIDKGTGNIAFRARFENPGNVLKNGSGGKVILKKSVSHALLIPQKCTMDVQDKQFVYVLDANNVAHMKQIMPLYRIPNYYILASGLSPTDRVLYEGLQVVKDGDKIPADDISFGQVTRKLAQL